MAGRAIAITTLSIVTAWCKGPLEKNNNRQEYQKSNPCQNQKYKLIALSTLILCCFILKEASGYAASSKNSFDFESSSDNYTL